MKQLVIYIHGKGGSADEAEHYKPLFADSDVVGFDYKAENPWEAKAEFPSFYEARSKGYDSVILIANSIGAFFSMCALGAKNISQALFISPITDMEKLISDMMMWANVTENMLEEKKEIPTTFGEKLSWEYLCYVRSHPIVWNIPTCILYGTEDNLTSIDTVSVFSDKIGAKLTVAENAPHWFHTAEQMKILDDWIKKSV